MPPEDKKIELDDERIDAITKKIADGGRDDLKKQQEIFSRINGGKDLSQFASQPISEAKVGTPENTPSVVIKSLRTFQGDAAEIIKNQNESVLTIALAEKKKVDQEIKTAPPANPELKKKVLIIATSVALVVLGVGAIIVFYNLQKRAPAVAELPPQEKAILEYSKIISLNVSTTTRDKLVEVLVGKKREADLRSDEIANVSLIKDTSWGQTNITASDFFTLLKTKAPSYVLRSFGESFMFGFYNTQENETFILIKLSSFENAFDGMLKWEANLNDDLGPLFTKRAPIAPVPPPPLQTSTTTSKAGSSSTPTIKIPQVLNFDTPDAIGFIDETVKNKDARILKNSRGDTILLYSFLDKETLLITSSEAVLEKMIEKINSQKIIR
jgi:hypothetical protein